MNSIRNALIRAQTSQKDACDQIHAAYSAICDEENAAHALASLILLPLIEESIELERRIRRVIEALNSPKQ